MSGNRSKKLIRYSRVLPFGQYITHAERVDDLLDGDVVFQQLVGVVHLDAVLLVQLLGSHF